MYRFGTQENREDVIALRWPRACLLCGVKASDEDSPQYAILGEFYEEKNTQVLLKMPGFFFVCNGCTQTIQKSTEMGNSQELAQKLMKHPWKAILKLEKNGTVNLPNGVFKNKLLQLNPDGKFGSIDDPMKTILDK
ncbi:MAG: hypothetical protein GF411_19415 [Candidatus Lokiarchaeota archaeon]|nr:hypothetical protein [Candidatus Lokiarchaeota archaeon]